MRAVLIDATPGVLRIQVDRDAKGDIMSAIVTVFEGDGARSVALDADGVEKAAEALCAPTPGNA